tara:strand:+ start:48 stop:185 length:138 start_codon:yes stop_codon:yes gene_type:complete
MNFDAEIERMTELAKKYDKALNQCLGVISFLQEKKKESSEKKEDK